MASKELPKGYEPGDVEDRWLDFWDKKRTFTPEASGADSPYSIVIPPPNVTGSLHMGHALNLTLQDILCRYHRQKGEDVLWVPGTDHAGIATQNVVEKSLAAEGFSRDDLGREKFVQRVWEWKEEYGNKILNQVRRLGASVDWTRQRFTMDEGLSRAVREVFVSLFEEGLIYQGDYIINWCPRCHTALADLEVEYEEIPGGLYHITYPLEDGSGEVIIATTRPETMLGDTAVAVNPADERYSDLPGKNVLLPLTGRKIPVIADEYVDMEFGTGCLKVTPAHDVNDFELGLKHDLEFLQVIDDKGDMSESAGSQFFGLDRFECRKKVVSMLKEQGLLARQQEYRHSVGHCYRCHTPIEPYVSKQWFVKTAPLAKKAARAVSEGETKIYPQNWEKTYFEWLDNIRDWCISRQIWWGHRIPAWTCESCGKLIVARQDPEACPQCGSSDLSQDEDVLDTWFSSALWPFSTLGWPDETEDLKTFYPTSVLVTGFDILFFWVARMMMMGIHFLPQVPFRDVYIHALVRDAEGQKMSKSKGNVIDPLLTIENFGADAFRFTLTAFAAMGRDIKMSEERIQGYRHFINKIWNAARFALMNLDEKVPRFSAAKADGFAHRWILHRLEEVKENVAAALDEYRFNDAAHELYQFVWHEFCDWYLEMIKPELQGGGESADNARSCLLQVLGETLVMLHPIIPFVTQEIWAHLPQREETNLALVGFPEKRPECRDEGLVRDMQFLQEVVVSVRNIRSELGIAPSKSLQVLVRAGGEDRDFLLAHEKLIQHLARVKEMQVEEEIEVPQGAASHVVRGYELFVPLQGLVDFESELSRLDKEIVKLNKELDIVGRKLANDDFVQKAPGHIVQKEQDKAERLEEKKKKLLDLHARLEKYANR
jgi:valyl-tRNA synthetase